MVQQCTSESDDSIESSRSCESIYLLWEFCDLGESGDSGKYDTWHMTNLKWFLGINWFGWV